MLDTLNATKGPSRPPREGGTPIVGPLSPHGPLRRRGEVEAFALFEVVLLGVADELPVVGERALAEVAEVLEDDLAVVAEAGRHLEQLHEFLDGEPAGEGLAG